MKARTDLYINKPSSTILALAKLVEGVIAGFCLFHIVWVLIQVIKGISKGAVDIVNALNSLFTELGFEQPVFDADKMNKLIEGVKVPIYAFVGIMALTGIILLLIVIDAIAVFLLRFTKAGSLVVRGIHRFYVFMCIVFLILFGYLTYLYFRSSADITKALGDTGLLMMGLTLTMVVIGIVYLAILFLQFCYHKDVARAMNTVHHEITTGQQGDLKRTHLSGISFIFAILYAIIVVAEVIIFLIPDISSKDMGLSQLIAVIAVPLIMMIKHFAVCFCNRNLKNAM